MRKGGGIRKRKREKKEFKVKTVKDGEIKVKQGDECEMGEIMFVYE